jgi:hypothetical protein
VGGPDRQRSRRDRRGDARLPEDHRTGRVPAATALREVLERYRDEGGMVRIRDQPPEAARRPGEARTYRGRVRGRLALRRVTPQVLLEARHQPGSGGLGRCQLVLEVPDEVGQATEALQLLLVT